MCQNFKGSGGLGLRRGNDSQGAFLRQKPAETTWVAFSTFNDNCLAQGKPKELKLISLKLPGKEDSEYVFNTISGG
jgi:hypothetical protein